MTKDFVFSNYVVTCNCILLRIFFCPGKSRFGAPGLQIFFALSLGNIAAGNLQKYVPFLLKEIEVSPEKTISSAIHSLKEVSNSF